MSAVNVHFAVDGPSDAPVVVFSPSLGTTLHMWEPQVARLRDRYRVVRYDHRGHGKSPVPAGPYRIADLGGDLVRLLDTLGVGSAHVCGLSVGGMTGMWVAAHEPDRIRRLLVLCCTSAHPRPRGVGAARRNGPVRRHDLRRRHRRQPVVHSGVGGRPPAGGQPGPADDRRQPRRGYAAAATRSGRSTSATTCRRSARGPSSSPARRYYATPPEHGRAIAGRIPDARLEILSPAAHLANIERAETVTDLLLDHLADEGAR